MIDTLKVETYLKNDVQGSELLTSVKEIFGEIATKHHMYLSRKESNERQRVWKTAGFLPDGILEFRVTQRFISSTICVSIKCKPSLITHKATSNTALSKMDDYEPTVNGLNHFITIINSHLKSFKLPPVIFWDVIRVDYAYQYSTPFYEALLYILNKGLAMAENKGYKKSAYFVNNCRNINFYDKTDKENLSEIDGGHLLRFEVQLKRKAVNKLIEKYGWERASIHHIWNEKIAKEIIIGTVEAMVGKYDFYKLSMAEPIVHDSFQSRKADLIIMYLKKTRYNKAKLNSLLSGRIEGLSENYIRRSIRPALNKISIAPILVPDCYHISILQNPIIDLQRM